MLHEILSIAYLLLPLLGGAAVHGLCWRADWLGFLASPIDHGLTFRGRPLFGRNKTWRGPVTVGIGAAVTLAVQAQVFHTWPVLAALELFDYDRVNPWLLGGLLGFAAELAELPNSFVKRQLGIAPGGTTHGFWAGVFYVWDQIDILLGAWLILAAVVPVSAWRIALSIGLVVVIHPLLTVIGYSMGMRGTRR